jgi:hypothetical protein
MDAPQLQILQHSLGLDEYGKGKAYRNHFCAGDRDEDVCRSLVTLGFMREGRASDLTGYDPVFFVTEAGEAAVRSQSPIPPRVSPGRARYLRWIEVADCFPAWRFGDFLKHTDSRGEFHPDSHPCWDKAVRR